MKSLLTASAFLLPLLGSASAQTSEAEALRVVDRFMAAFNDQDLDGLAAACHFPHVRIGGGDVTVWETVEEFTTRESREQLQSLLKAAGWHRSEWESREVLQSSADKVHVVGRFTRYRKDGSAIGTYDSLWMVTRREGRWGVQARSSFVPGVEAQPETVVQTQPAEVGTPSHANEAPAERARPQKGPCAWFDWPPLMERFPPHPADAQTTKARRRKGSIKRPHSGITHRINGHWIVEAVVDEKGKVRDARIKAMPWIDPPWPAYEAAIVKSIRRWRFEPGTVNGEPRPSCTTVRFEDE